MKTRAAIVLVVVGSIALVAAASYGIVQARKRAAETQCRNNLVQIGLGLLSYSDNHNAFPAARADGHSWRIRCISYMRSTPQLQAYDFESPWNADINITVHTRPLPSKSGELVVYGHPYGPPCDRDDADCTSYLLIVGDDAFAASDRERDPDEITDGLANTIAAAEIADSSVHWLSPRDLDFDSMSFVVNDGPNSISSRHPTGPAVLFCDGEVFRLNPQTPAETVRALCTINGGEQLSRDSLVAQGYLIR